MNSITEAKVKMYLRNELRYDPYNCGTIVESMQSLARAGGFVLDARFGTAALAAGPEARVASGIVQLAMGEGGSATSKYAIRTEIDRWLRTNPARGK